MFRCFRYVSEKKNYFSAELYCVNVGSHLTSVRNMYDNAFISRKFTLILFQAFALKISKSPVYERSSY